MDLKVYYQRIRETASKIDERFPVVVSHETPEGGKGGILTEVTPEVAARLVVEGHGRLANADEVRRYREQQARALRQAEQEAAATRVQLAVLSLEELKRLRELPEGD